MNDELMEAYKRKLIESEKKIEQLNNHKLILISIFNEVNKGRDIKLNNSLRDVDLQENISCLNDWIEFHSGDIQKYENKMRKIAASKKTENPIIKIGRIEKWKNSNEIEEKNPKTEGSFNFTKNFKPKSLFKFLIVCFVLALAIVGVYNLKPRITGLAAITEQLNYTSNINQEFYKSSEYTWNLDNAGDLRSIRIYGSKTKHGSANVYIENNEIRYLLLNSSELAEKESGIFGITGFAVKSDIKKSLKGELSEEEKEILELLIEDINTTRNNISIEIEAKKGEVSKEIKGNATYSQNYLINNLSLSLNGSDEKIQIKIEAEFEELAEENTAPLWNSNITNFTIDKTLTLNLSEYFYDADNDSLTYSSSSAPNVAAIIVGDVITIIPDETVNGTIQLTLAAFDGTAIGFQILSFDIKAKEFKEEINKTINISLDYGDNPVYDANNDGVETLTGVVDITPAKSAFSWEADEEKLCAKYEVYSFENKESEFACFGSNNCCNFLQLESSKELWNESLYLAYGSYGSTANNIVSAQVFFVDYNLSLENPYSEIAASSRAGLTAKFLEDFIQFEDVCLDTCFVYGFNSSSYKLVIEIDNATLRIDKIAYTIEKAAANETITNATNITNQAPALIKSIENISIASNKNYTLNLSQYFSDPDNDTLVYSYYKTDNLTILLENSIALIIPDSSFEGIAFTYIIANDSESSAASNVFMINVSQANLSEEIKPKVRVGKPVKWQKKILVDVSNVSSVNFTLPETASNISIKILNQTEQRELQDEKIKIIEDSKVKDKELFELEKKIENIGKKASILEEAKQKSALKVTIDEKEFDINEIDLKLSELYSKKSELEQQLSQLLNVNNNLITGSIVALTESLSAIIINETRPILLINESLAQNVEITVEYETPAPIAIEDEINSYTKQIKIISDTSYDDVLAYTTLNDAPQQAIKLYWIQNDSRQLFENVNYFDENNNGLVDRIEWIIPHLSNQTFEVSITVLNVQSYPTVGGNWTVAFNTTGTGNLTIIASNGTSYAEVPDNTSTINDLEYLETRCNADILNTTIACSNGEQMPYDVYKIKKRIAEIKKRLEELNQ